MKEYFKTDDKQFAFRPKKTSPLSLIRPIKLNLIGNFKFLNEYKKLFRIDEDVFLCTNVNEYFKGGVNPQEYPLAILNIKDNTLKGIDLKRSSPGGFRLGFCKFKGKWETFISFSGESKIFMIKDLTAIKVLDNYTIYSDSNNDYACLGFNGMLKMTAENSFCYIFDGEKLSYVSNDYAGGCLYGGIVSFNNAISPSILGDSDFSRKRDKNLLANLIGASTPTFSGKAIFLKKDELYIAQVFQDDVIEIKE